MQSVTLWDCSNFDKTNLVFLATIEFIVKKLKEQEMPRRCDSEVRFELDLYLLPEDPSGFMHNAKFSGLYFPSLMSLTVRQLPLKRHILNFLKRVHLFSKENFLGKINKATLGKKLWLK